MKTQLLRLLSVTVALTVAAFTGRAAPFELGLQTWTLRNMEFDQVVEFAVQHGIRKLQVTSKHVDPNGPMEETKRRKAILDRHGLRLRHQAD